MTLLPQLFAAAAILSAQAQPAAPACVTREQAADLVLVQLPDAVTTVSQQCTASLPADAFLRSGVTGWVERLRAEGGARRASALAGFTALTAGRLPQGITPDLAMSGMSSMFLGQALSGRMNPAACAEASRLLEAFSALPPANVATMVSAGLGLAMAMRGAPAPAPAAGGAPAAPAAPRNFGPLCAG